jgi:pimeloyl-ACP methyl ester carboxylesterase
MNRMDAVAVRRWGAKGPPLVVLHGGPGAPGSARGLAQLLSDRFTVWEPLQRRAGGVPLTVQQHVDDLAAVAPAPALVVGHSWGAMLGLSFASRHPNAVAKLALVGCGTYHVDDRAQIIATVRERLGAEEQRLVSELEERLAHESNPAVREAALAQLGAIHSRLQSYALIDDRVEEVQDPPLDAIGHVQTWNDVLRLQREGVEPAAFTRIRAPVLMLHGSFDTHPGRATRDRLRQYLPQLEYVELERCGHEPWREQHARAEFAAILGDWLEQTGARGV